MSTYLEEVEQIITILKKADQKLVVKQIENAKLMGGTGGEILIIICSLLKTYEIQIPSWFNLIKKHADELYRIAESVSLYPAANFDLLDELSK